MATVLVQFNLKMHPSELVRMKALAKKKGTSVAALLRGLVEEEEKRMRGRRRGT